jgi:hypothetical protein
MPEEKRQVGRRRRRWVDNIKMDLTGNRMAKYGWIDLALVNMVMNIRVLQNAGKFLSSCKTGDFSRRAQLHKVS